MNKNDTIEEIEENSKTKAEENTKEDYEKDEETSHDDESEKNAKINAENQFTFIKRGTSEIFSDSSEEIDKTLQMKKKKPKNSIENSVDSEEKEDFRSNPIDSITSQILDDCSEEIEKTLQMRKKKTKNSIENPVDSEKKEDFSENSMDSTNSNPKNMMLSKNEEFQRKPNENYEKFKGNSNEKHENFKFPEEFLKKSEISQKEAQILEELNLELLSLNSEKSSFFISVKRSLMKKAEEYQGNLQIRTTIEKAAKSYSYRAVKGDGNCSYRSIAFLYLEQILNNITKIEDLQKKKPVKTFFDRLFSTNFDVFIKKNSENAEIKKKILENHGLLKKYLLKMLMDLIKLRILNISLVFTEFSDFITKIINENPLLDFAILAFLRDSIKRFFVENRKEYKPFLAENADYEKTIGEIDFQGDHMVIKFASDLLGIKVNIVEIGAEFRIFEPLTPQKEEFDEIHLYYRNGHYDILYKDEDYKGKSEKSETSDKSEKFEKNVKKGRKSFLNIFRDLLTKKSKKLEKNCDKCNLMNDVIKSKKCAHFFCLKCIFTSGQGDNKDFYCLLCKCKMMTVRELNKKIGLITKN